MLISTLVPVAVWKRYRKQPEKRVTYAVVIGLLTVITTIFTGAFLPVVDVPIDSDQTLRTFPPTSFPFTMQQYRDYSTNQFHYRIVLGWPDGYPVYEFESEDDQSHLIRAQHFQCAIKLSSYILLGFILSGIIILPLEFRIRKDAELKDASETEILDDFPQRIVISLVVFGTGFVFMWLSDVITVITLLPPHMNLWAGIALVLLGWILFVCFTLFPRRNTQ